MEYKSEIFAKDEKDRMIRKAQIDEIIRNREEISKKLSKIESRNEKSDLESNNLKSNKNYSEYNLHNQYSEERNNSNLNLKKSYGSDFRLGIEQKFKEIDLELSKISPLKPINYTSARDYNGDIQKKKIDYTSTYTDLDRKFEDYMEQKKNSQYVSNNSNYNSKESNGYDNSNKYSSINKRPHTQDNLRSPKYKKSRNDNFFNQFQNNNQGVIIKFKEAPKTYREQNRYENSLKTSNSYNNINKSYSNKNPRVQSPNNLAYSKANINHQQIHSVLNKEKDYKYQEKPKVNKLTLDDLRSNNYKPYPDLAKYKQNYVSEKYTRDQEQNKQELNQKLKMAKSITSPSKYSSEIIHSPKSKTKIDDYINKKYADIVKSSDKKSPSNRKRPNPNKYPSSDKYDDVYGEEIRMITQKLNSLNEMIKLRFNYEPDREMEAKVSKLEYSKVIEEEQERSRVTSFIQQECESAKKEVNMQYAKLKNSLSDFEECSAKESEDRLSNITLDNPTINYTNPEDKYSRYDNIRSVNSDVRLEYLPGDKELSVSQVKSAQRLDLFDGINMNNYNYNGDEKEKFDVNLQESYNQFHQKVLSDKKRYSRGSSPTPKYSSSNPEFQPQESRYYTIDNHQPESYRYSYAYEYTHDTRQLSLSQRDKASRHSEELDYLSSSLDKMYQKKVTIDLSNHSNEIYDSHINEKSKINYSSSLHDPSFTIKNITPISDNYHSIEKSDNFMTFNHAHLQVMQQQGNPHSPFRRLQYQDQQEVNYNWVQGREERHPTHKADDKPEVIEVDIKGRAKKGPKPELVMRLTKGEGQKIDPKEAKKRSKEMMSKKTAFSTFSPRKSNSSVKDNGYRDKIKKYDEGLRSSRVILSPKSNKKHI